MVTKTNEQLTISLLKTLRRRRLRRLNLTLRSGTLRPSKLRKHLKKQGKSLDYLQKQINWKGSPPFLSPLLWLKVRLHLRNPLHLPPLPF